jgi:hypothetical protein
MKIKHWLSVSVLTLGLCSTVRAQDYADQPEFPAPAPLQPGGLAVHPAEYVQPPGGVLSDWITYKRDCCEGHEGPRTPLYNEVYIDAGPSTPVGGAVLSHELRTGWSFTGGGRTLLFNDPLTSAWVVDLHIRYTNEGSDRNTQFPVVFFQNGTRSDQVLFQGKTGQKLFTIQDATRVMVGAGVGRDWYCWQPADCDGCNCRLGLDVGGRYGYMRVAFNEFGHVGDVIGSFYIGCHADVEVPCRSCLYHAGVRFEWAYTWSDILQRTCDLQELSVLLTVGVRF